MTALLRMKTDLLIQRKILIRYGWQRRICLAVDKSRCDVHVAISRVTGNLWRLATYCFRDSEWAPSFETLLIANLLHERPIIVMETAIGHIRRSVSVGWLADAGVSTLVSW
jgi:hypothetical protein